MQDGPMEMQVVQLLEDRGASPINEDNSSVEEDIEAEVQPVISSSSMASAPGPEEPPTGAGSSSSTGNKEAEKKGRR